MSVRVRSLLAGLLLPALAPAQDSAVLHRLSDEILLRGTCYTNLRTLCKTVGNRLSGTPQAAQAVQWGKKALQDAGADRVWLQPVTVPVWVRGAETLQLDLGSGFRAVPVLSLGNSEGTGGKPVERGIVAVRSFDEFNALPDSAVRGRFVFFNYRFRQDLVSTFEGYGDAGPYRWRGPNLAAARGAAGVIIRSISTGEDDQPHTGSMRYADTARKIPAVAIGNKTADALEVACKTRAVKARLTSNCGMHGTAPSYNVIGELSGSELPDEILVVGGHLDSWDVGEGAHDDGAGCVQSIEVLRTFKALGLRPKRTVRAVLFMNEENGVRGGHAYADSAGARNEHHIFALESDAGGFSPRGFSFDTRPLPPPANARYDSAGLVGYRARAREALVQRARQLEFLGVHDFHGQHGGTDIEPLEAIGAVQAGLSPDPQRYFDVHHTAADVFEAVNHRELKLGAAAMAGLIWLVAEEGLPAR